MMPRRFFFGLVEVQRWGWLSGMTIAQIELLTMDVPFVAYKRIHDRPKPGQKGYSMTSEQADKAYRDWQKRKKAREERWKEKGVKIDFNTFLQTGEKKEV